MRVCACVCFLIWSDCFHQPRLLPVCSTVMLWHYSMALQICCSSLHHPLLAAQPGLWEILSYPPFPPGFIGSSLFSVSPCLGNFFHMRMKMKMNSSSVLYCLYSELGTHLHFFFPGSFAFVLVFSHWVSHCLLGYMFLCSPKRSNIYTWSHTDVEISMSMWALVFRWNNATSESGVQNYSHAIFLTNYIVVTHVLLCVEKTPAAKSPNPDDAMGCWFFFLAKLRLNCSSGKVKHFTVEEPDKAVWK